MPTYAQALVQLSQAIRAPSHSAQHENWHFQAALLSAEQVAAIRAHTQNQLPESYYQFLAACGTGEFFASWYSGAHDGEPVFMPCVQFYNLAELVEQNQYYQQLAQEELAACPPEELPDDVGDIFIIGAHQSMGDWFGFDRSRSEPNFDIFIHDGANPATYAKEAQWRRFDDWIIQCVQSHGENTL